MLFGTWLCVALLQHSASAVNTRLLKVFSWKALVVRENGTTDDQLESEQFTPAHNMPSSIELWADRVFLAVPRIKPGVFATLVFFKLNSTADNVTESPELAPYPNLETNNITDLKTWPPQLLSVMSMRADACDRLWVLDVGSVDLVQLAPPKLLLYDLKTDKLLFAYPLKEKSNYNEESFFTSLTVDVTSTNCDSAYVYLPDAHNYNLVVYSLLTNDTHVLTHNYFHFDPLSGDFSSWQSQTGVFGTALSPVDREGYRTVFFHSLASTMEFAVNSKYLQNTSIATEKSWRAFKVVGNRGAGGQSAISFLDEETGVLFFTLVKRHAVGCWNSFKGEEYEERSLGKVADEMMKSSYPVDLRVDKKGYLWVLVAPLLPLMLGNTPNISVTNIWVFRAPVRQAIKSTVCDEM